LVVDKPEGWTSHDVVNRVRRLAGERSIGHLGTLDPMGTGVLPLLIGSATRLAKFFTRADKVYEVSIRFGFATDTYDATGERAGDELPVSFTREELEEALTGFHGVIQQLPPRFSAKKIRGVPAYKLARAHKEVELAPVEIEIFEIQILSFAVDQAALRVHCGSGTYVRSLAHDLGLVLQCGAHLTALRRTRSGDFAIENAHTLQQLEQNIVDAVLPASQLLPGFPAVVVDSASEAQIRHGRNFRTNPFRVDTGAKFVKALTESGALLAVGEAVLPNLYHPVVVLP
jgi:tRNA pseudouridine55 synthase